MSNSETGDGKRLWARLMPTLLTLTLNPLENEDHSSPHSSTIGWVTGKVTTMRRGSNPKVIQEGLPFVYPIFFRLSTGRAE